jgi:hypothetical protein
MQLEVVKEVYARITDNFPFVRISPTVPNELNRSVER